MKEFGIGEALIGNIFLDNQPAGPTKVLSEEWWQLVEHAIREGGRLGVNIGMFNCPGWSQSGGPWIPADQTMRRVASSEIRVTGPKKFSEKLQVPNEPFQDIAVLAFPAPKNDGEKLAGRSPRICCTPEIPEAKNLIDGNPDTAIQFPVNPADQDAVFTMDIELDAPLTARSLSLFPMEQAFGAHAELQVKDEAGKFQSIRKFKCDRSNQSVGTGFMPRGPATISFPAVTSHHFRVIFSSFFGQGAKPSQALGEIEISGTPPVKSPSLANQPQADEKVRSLAAEIWGDSDTTQPGEREFGKGRVIWGKDLTAVFTSSKILPDIEFRDAPKDANLLFTHRSSKDAEIYFISNQKDRLEKANCTFRVTGLQPEIWDAVTGERRNLPEWSEQSGQTTVPLAFAPKQSWFVVFRHPGKPNPNAGENFPEMKPVITLAGAWKVAFNPKWGGPEKVEFLELSDWTKRPEEGIKYYSGSATYQLEFQMGEIPSGKSILDLGKVHDLATVRLNGKDLGTIWTAPWQVDISSAIKTGANTLEIMVTNPWNNRLVGDHKLPAEQRLTSISLGTIGDTTPLLPAGLLGPVSI